MLTMGKVLQVFMIVFLGTFQNVLAGLVDGKISRIRDATHVEFSGRVNWDYEFRRVKEGKKIRYMLIVSALDDESVSRLSQWRGSLVESIRINKKAIDNSYEIIFTLRNNRIESFDYITDGPSRLIVDFFYKPKNRVIKTKYNKLMSDLKSTKNLKVNKKRKSRLRKRKPAGSEFIRIDGHDTVPKKFRGGFSHGIFDGGDPDYSRFAIADHEIKKKAIRASEQQIYLPFPMLMLESSYLKGILEKPPIYEIVKGESAENKEAQLLLSLYNRDRFAIFLKTINYFRSKHPKSKYDEIIRFLEADVYYKLWQRDRAPVDFENAMTRYRVVVEKYPNSPLAERTLLLMGYSYLDRGDNLGTLKSLQKFLRNRPQSVNKDRVRITIAGAYLALNKYKDAFKILDSVEKSLVQSDHAVEAAYHKGRGKDYKRSISEYLRARKKYPNLWYRFPNAYFNVAESLFWQKKYRKSLIFPLFSETLAANSTHSTWSAFSSLFIFLMFLR